jgi:hypothetical protein
MNDNREHYVASQAPDWRASKPGHEHRPLAEHRDPLTWPVLALIGVVAVAILLWQAGVFV